jgi:predicted RNA-binding protein (virulence factor B family)
MKSVRGREAIIDYGRVNRLEVAAIDDEGAWLKAGHERALLSRRELGPGVAVGDHLEVFVYAGADGDALATLRWPLAEVGEFALMRVAQLTTHGAFMDWGLAKNLLVPPKEQPEPMQMGRRYLVKVRLDRQGRPIGTAWVERCLSSADESLSEGQQVELTVWKFTPLGAKVIVDHRFAGLLYRDEVGNRLKYGDRLKGYIRHIRPDGRIDCTLRSADGGHPDDARAVILQALREGKGFLPLHDKSPPAMVQERLGMSKKVFKKAVGGLYKAGLISLVKNGLKLIDKG